MNAQEARKLAETATASEIDIMPIRNAIASAVRQGKMEIFWHKEINILSRKALEADGYKVDGFADRDGIIYKISW